MTDSDFDGDDSSLEDEDASPAPRKRSRQPEQAEGAQTCGTEEVEEGFLVQQEAGDTKVEVPRVEKRADDGVQSSEKKAKLEDKASQAAVVTKMADWSDDDDQ